MLDMRIDMSVIDDFKARGFVDSFTDEGGLYEYLSTSRSCYIGFDPTASSLHVGSLVPIMALSHMQKAGHKPIVLVGGGTGMIGDPSGKTEMRNMLTVEKVDENKKSIKAQLAKFISFDSDGALLLDNADWLLNINYIEFLRDVGRFFSINRMIKMESYKTRMESETGLSFLEFNYTIMQAYDFNILSQKYDCRLQMGGSDQWGNIVAGIDLIRRIQQKEAYGLTFPLVTTSSGGKMGKTEKGAVWLDPDKTSPYEYFQFWINTEDGDVKRFLSLFTFLPMEEIVAVEKLTGKDLNPAKVILAFETTKLVHGEDEAVKAYMASASMFGLKDLPEMLLPSSTINRKANVAKVESLPTSEISEVKLNSGVTFLELFVESGLCKSKSDARRLISQGGAYFNDLRVTNLSDNVKESSFVNGELLLRAGKKRYYRFILK